MFNLRFLVDKFRNPTALNIVEQQILISYDEEFLVDLFQRSIVVLDKTAAGKGVLFRIAGPREDIAHLKELAVPKVSNL